MIPITCVYSAWSMLRNYLIKSVTRPSAPSQDIHKENDVRIDPICSVLQCITARECYSSPLGVSLKLYCVFQIYANVGVLNLYRPQLYLDMLVNIVVSYILQLDVGKQTNNKFEV